MEFLTLAPGSDRIPVELFQILKDDAVESAALNMQYASSRQDLGLIPAFGRSPGGGHGNPLQYSCLKNPMDRGPWQAIVLQKPVLKKPSTTLRELENSDLFRWRAQRS